MLFKIFLFLYLYSSAKWWPGGLGHTATHAVVYANLILKEKNFGPHPFMVQLRSLQDHNPLPGITLGDLGPKQVWIFFLLSVFFRILQQLYGSLSY